MQSPSLQNPPKSSSRPEGEHIKKDKGKKVMYLEEAEKESNNIDSNDDETHLTGSMVESSKIKKVKKFDFITEGGKHIHLTEEEINHQKKIEEDAKAEAAKRESEVRKEELVDLLESRITNCDVLTKKGPITLKVYIEDGTSEVIPNFKASDLHLGEWREVMNACPNRTGKGWKIIYDQISSRMDYIHTTEAELGINLDIPLSKQDPLDKLNDLANKKRKHADDIHDYFKANKRIKSSVYFTQAEVLQFESLKVLQLQLFKSLEDWEKVYKAGQRLIYVKRNKAISLGKEFKFEGDNTSIVIGPPCYSASKGPTSIQNIMEEHRREGSVLPRILWKNLNGDAAEAFRTRVAEGATIQEEVISASNENCDAQVCSNYRGIKLLGHTMKLWERVIERRLQRETRVSENQFSRGNTSYQKLCGEVHGETKRPTFGFPRSRKGL
ncbi:hypothetical protein Tco_0988729 [Tanacetum coccineum]|uniref:Uncharacterized protein n=1 Tax=Tanacetum coccineum TaxID=301880 RepID=A0ABQ5ERU8_9ASTR